MLAWGRAHHGWQRGRWRGRRRRRALAAVCSATGVAVWRVACVGRVPSGVILAEPAAPTDGGARQEAGDEGERSAAVGSGDLHRRARGARTGPEHAGEGRPSTAGNPLHHPTRPRRRPAPHRGMSRVWDGDDSRGRSWTLWSSNLVRAACGSRTTMPVMSAPVVPPFLWRAPRRSCRGALASARLPPQAAGPRRRLYQNTLEKLERPRYRYCTLQCEWVSLSSLSLS